MEKIVKEEIILQNIPLSDSLWKGLGGNFDSLTQIIDEFIDNSISNFIKYNQIEIKKIIIRVEELENKSYKIEIEDTGKGIENLDIAFSIGNNSEQDSSLNEHGFGMKHALSAANPENDNWSVITRTDEDGEGSGFSEIKAPFNIMNQKCTTYEKGWSGIQSTGTIISFIVNETWYNTLTRGLRGNFSNMDTIMEVLSQDIGYVYGKFIEDSIASISIRYKNITSSEFTNIDVGSISPAYNNVINPGIGDVDIDLGHNEIVKIKYEFLQAIDSNLYRYYKANMATSGVEIRINGRLLESSLFTEIWGKEKHNSYNYILIRLNLISENSSFLPRTTTNKSGIRKDDPKLEKIFDWIRSKLSDPERQASLSKDELDLFQQLKEHRLSVLKDIDESCIVETEKYTFTTLNERIRIDLYESFGDNIVIYEGKKDRTSPIDVYQLIMYWDGLVMDRVPVNKAILVAKEHPESVRALVNIKKDSFDKNEDKYNIELKTWKELGIKYPN